jgi:ribosomal-protein-alanine N-acetyltransferase
MPDEFPVIELGEYVLRRIEASDAADCDRYRRNPEVTRYTSIDADNEPAAEGIAYLAQAFADKREIRWAIAARASGWMVGDCGFFAINYPHARAEIGYVLAREHWGRGVASAAVGAMVRWGFTTLELHRIEAIIHPGNIASIRVAERAGFQREGVLHERTRIRGTYCDMVMFALLAKDWHG